MHTVEVRWFSGGEVPAEIRAWFQRGERPAEEQPGRVDHYLCLGETDWLGIKLREGRIEIKQRQRSYGIVRFHARVHGMVEHWHKWSYAITGGDGDLDGLPAPTASWIGVQKKRRLGKYVVTEGGTIVAIPVEEYPARGCSLELTEITARGRSWWTLGFEAFGYENRLQENLFLVAKHVLAREPVPTLAAPDSCGYPAWLRTLG